ncbi:MAG: pyroglutamyl-peptidase I [Gemella haemolysans]|uniref:pyroglutamyl-peptidase I n=1 Tax=Gemella haemolysans TaxID=1379 RepID=UPI00121A5CFD|nr:pyroglutamyl-peptidase I [Gemella haemolysans]MBS5319458.1 pyroglutamyl-peptidase I [Gemella haemolysans]TKW63364.1 MAG: pyroglutamyl-peptidase I [Gemella sp.]
MRVLITGFDKFGGESINPSNLCVNSLPDVIDNIEIKKITLPTVFKDSSRVLEENIDLFSPNIVICIGQAGGRSKITPERIAINIDDARIPDNIGNSPIDETIRKDGENAYFSTLPIKAIVDELNKNNIPSTISNTAGTFVCNHIMYESLYLTSTKYPNIKAGFIHIPYIEEQVLDKPNMPYMKKEDIIVALELIIKTAVTYYDKKDRKLTGGLEH